MARQQQNKKILVIGSYIAGMVIETERLPENGETLAGKNFRHVHGGKGMNQAVQASRLGADVSILTRVGNDNYGKDFFELCKQENIPRDYAGMDDTLPTATGFIICSEDGENMIIIDFSALNHISREEIEKTLNSFDEHTIVLIQFEIPYEIALFAAKIAREKGMTTIINPAPAVDSRDLDLTCVDYFTPNKNEAKVCMGFTPDDEIRQKENATLLLERGCKNVIITDGNEGCLLVNHQRTIQIPGFKVNPVKDSTGAGDAFNAALAVAVSEHEKIEEALVFANGAGALACKKWHSIPSFHTRQEIEQFINSR